MKLGTHWDYAITSRQCHAVTRRAEQHYNHASERFGVICNGLQRYQSRTPGTTQGDYFTQTVGPYDEWAIAYGYTPSNALVPQAEMRLLDKIAGRASEPALAYATDEDIYAGLDPLATPFDLSGDLLTYAPWQMENALKMWQTLDQSSPAKGDSFSDVRQKFDEIFYYYSRYSRFLTTYVGGQSFNRFRGGDVAGRLPFEPVPPSSSVKHWHCCKLMSLMPINFGFPLPS
jgi:hypothetical protein